MYKAPLIVVILFLSKISFSQNCSCLDNFIWLKETFENNDAGFKYTIDKKGEDSYKMHSQIYTEKVKTISNSEICIETLREWLRYFRNGHLWLESTTSKEVKVKEKIDEELIRKQFVDWEKYKFKEKEFYSYISQLKVPSLEGIWSSPPYKIGVIKIKNEYIGFVIEADGVYWTKNQVKFKIKEDNGKLNGVYYMRDHSASEIKNIKLIGNNYLSIGTSLFNRIEPIFPADKLLDISFKFQSTRVPIFEKLSDRTVLLRIPSFDGSAKKQIDSVINSNLSTITKTENLIIDLQNNGGGSDGSYEMLIPLIYTNPIRIVGVEFLSTKLNNKRMEEFANDPNMSLEARDWAKEALNKLNSNLGNFVNLNGKIVSLETSETNYTFPKNVGILINGSCGSTTEQFILAAKQSKKVKLFGTTTYGSLDISNMFSVKSPCKELELGYCLSKSLRIPDFTVDGIGLQPDYYIDKEIPAYEWIDFVHKILSGL